MPYRNFFGRNKKYQEEQAEKNKKEEGEKGKEQEKAPAKEEADKKYNIMKTFKWQLVRYLSDKSIRDKYVELE